MARMRAFDVHVNGKKLCLAGVGIDGAFAAIISHVVDKDRDGIRVSVGGTRGVTSALDENIQWASRTLKTGDEITLRIVEAESVDRPRTRKQVDHAETRRTNERLCRVLAKTLGWQIVARPK